MIIVAVFFLFTSKGPVIYWSKRVGQNNVIFTMPKFRTMWIETPAIATHLVESHDELLSPIGSLLRRTSLDELPQLFSVLKGHMSFVGPRPALFNQEDLISLRKEKGVDKLLPGITGWAQINGRDELSISENVALDVEYMEQQTFWMDLRILLMTFSIVFNQDNISN